MSRLRNKPYFWVTWLTSLLSGEDSCEGKVWMKGHYQDLNKRPREDMSKWNENHTALLNDLREAHGPPKCSQMLVEGQTAWKIEGRTAIVAGKMDIITLKPNLVIDAKSGKAKDSHVMQMKIYLLAIELGAVPGVKGHFGGLVCYPRGRPTKVNGLDSEFKDRFFNLVRRLAGDKELAKVPSLFECKYCDLADCEERFTEAETAQTDAF